MVKRPSSVTADLDRIISAAMILACSKLTCFSACKKRLRHTSPPDASQLAAAIEYHRLALLATSDEARLVNLWIALEALCQGGEGSIIERVWSRISPCVSVENIRKNLVSLSIYVKRTLGSRGPIPFLALFPNSSETRLEPSDLVAVLLLPNGHADQKKLYDLCANHPLILHRLFRAQTMMLNEAKAVAANLEFTCRNVEWQIKRIYRVRNAIVHTGNATALLPQLNQHLHCYLIKAIHTVLIDLDRQPRWTIKDSLEHRLKLFKYVVDFFRKKPDHEIGAAAITDPETCLRPQNAPFAWPPPPVVVATSAGPTGGQPAAQIFGLSPARTLTQPRLWHAGYSWSVPRRSGNFITTTEHPTISSDELLPQRWGNPPCASVRQTNAHSAEWNCRQSTERRECSSSRETRQKTTPFRRGGNGSWTKLGLRSGPGIFQRNSSRVQWSRRTKST